MEMPPAGAATAPAQSRGIATLIYDADCAMCRKSALWLMRRAHAGGELEILPCRSPIRHERFPQVSEDACLSAMQLVLPDGRRLSGADAVPELFRRIHGWGWLAGFFALPPVRPVARGVYGWVARNRMRISCALDRRS